jgi:hypothetical protein
MQIRTPTPSSLRRYPLEWAIFALSGAVVTLFFMVNDLNKYIRVSLTEQVIMSREAVKEAKQTTELFINTQKQNEHANSN